MENEKIYDKPRITSTVIIGVFMLISVLVIASVYPLSWSAINDAKNNNAGDVIIAIVAAMGIVLVIALLFITMIVDALLLLFSIFNRKSTLKPVRIISYVYDGILGAAILASIIKVILLFCGV